MLGQGSQPEEEKFCLEGLQIWCGGSGSFPALIPPATAGKLHGAPATFALPKHLSFKTQRACIKVGVQAPVTALGRRQANTPLLRPAGGSQPPPAGPGGPHRSGVHPRKPPAVLQCAAGVHSPPGGHASPPPQPLAPLAPPSAATVGSAALDALSSHTAMAG